MSCLALRRENSFSHRNFQFNTKHLCGRVTALNVGWWTYLGVPKCSPGVSKQWTNTALEIEHRSLRPLHIDWLASIPGKHAIVLTHPLRIGHFTGLKHAKIEQSLGDEPSSLRFYFYRNLIGKLCMQCVRLGLKYTLFSGISDKMQWGDILITELFLIATKAYIR